MKVEFYYDSTVLAARRSPATTRKAGGTRQTARREGVNAKASDLKGSRWRS